MNYPKLAKYKKGGSGLKDCYEDGGGLKGLIQNIRENRRRKGKGKLYKGRRCSKSKTSKYTRTRGR